MQPDNAVKDDEILERSAAAAPRLGPASQPPQTPRCALLARLARRLRPIVALDLRSLALFRMGLACLLLLDLAGRADDLRAFYSDDGILPRAVLATGVLHTSLLSVYNVSGEVAVQGALFVVAAVFAFGLGLGLWTRTCALVSWVMLSSLQLRNPLVLNGSDDYLRLLTFLSVFLPVSRVWSFDAWRRGNRAPTGLSSGGSGWSVVSPWTLALVVQMFVVYGVTAAVKTGPEWHSEATAVYYALSLESFTRPFGVWLRQFPETLKALTHVVWYWEVVGSVLLLAPDARVRAVVLLGFAVFHAGLAASMSLGLFSPICCVALVALAPTIVWESLERRLGRALGGEVLSAGDGDPPIRAATGLVLPAGSHRFGSHRFGARRLGAQALRAFAVVYIVTVLALAYVVVRNQPPSALAFRVAHALNLGQRWDMFAPAPKKIDGWVVIEGRLKNGESVDLWTGRRGPVSYEKPGSIADRYPSIRWFYLSLSVVSRPFAEFDQLFASFICRSWNEHVRGASPLSLESLEMTFMAKPDPLLDPGGVIQRMPLYAGACDGEPRPFISPRPEVPAGSGRTP